MVYAFGRGSEAGQTIGTVASDIFSFPPSMEIKVNNFTGTCNYQNANPG